MNLLFQDMAAMAPEIILAVGTMALMVVGAFGRGGGLRTVSILSVLLWFAAAVFVWMSAGAEVERVFNDSIIIDPFARVAKTMIAAGCIAALLISLSDLKGTIMARFEYPVLMGFACLGMFLMVSANDLLMLYVGLELSSLALYVLAAFNRNSSASSEAGLKYFVLGALSSGLILYGASLLYGFCGSLQFDIIAATTGAISVPGPAPIIVTFGMVMVLAGMTFKIAAVPFHMWTPDVYEGAPTPVTAFFAIVPKVAAIVLLARLLSGPFAGLIDDWKPVISFMAVASMIVGAFAAIVQTNLKRLLAYSSISNIGYALIGLAIGTQSGLTSLIVYMVIYMAGTIGVFGIILLLRRDGFGITRIEDLSGLSRARPGLAYGLAALMFSYSGIPPLAGFFGKLAIFESAVAAQAYVLAVIGVVTSVVAAWYYINIIRVMFFEGQDATAQPAITYSPSVPGLVLVTLSLAFTGLFIFMPGPLSNLAVMATAGLLP